jgi:DNA invertase Pin-like site-specific DNA recombinase
VKQQRAIVYTRVSTEEQADNGTSMTDQRTRSLEFAESRGFWVRQVFEDPGVSGALYETRPGLQAAIQTIERKEAELLIVTKIDRLARKTKILLDIAERVDRAGGQIVTCDGTEYGKTTQGKLMLTAFAMFAEFERDTIRDRSIAGKIGRVQQGKQPIRAKSPYGYRIVTEDDVKLGKYPLNELGTYQIVEEQAYWARQMFQMFDLGISLNKIATFLDSKGVPPPSAARSENQNVQRWWPTTVRTILENSVYKGEATFGRMMTVSGENLEHKLKPGQRLKAGKRYEKQQEWMTIPAPPLVDVEVWERCSIRLNQNTVEKKAILGGNPDRKYMLSGLTRCPTCGRALSGQKKKATWDGKEGDKVSYYTCRGYLRQRCPGKKHSFFADDLEELTLLALVYILEHPESLTSAIRAFDEYKRHKKQTEDATAEQTRLTAELERLNSDLNNVKKAMIAGLRAGLREDDFATELASIAKRRAVIEVRLKELDPEVDDWNGEEPETIAEKLQAVIRAIITVFTANTEELIPAEKQAILARLLESVTPAPDGQGARVVLRPDVLQTVQFVDMHCVTRWSRLGNLWEGVSTREIIQQVTLKPEAKYVLVHAYDRAFSLMGGSANWSTNMPLEYFLDEDCLFADTHDGEPISLEHGGPLRLVIPKLYAWKSAKWVKGVEFRDSDTPGFWERGGYNMLGDPWKEQRYRFSDEE